MEEQNWNRPDWQPPQGAAPQPQPTYYYPGTVTKEMLPPQYRPLSAWAYFGLNILFSIPLVGFICLIVFSFNDSNINLRSYARSYWCMYLLAAVLVVLFVIIFAVTGASLDLFDGLYY